MLKIPRMKSGIAHSPPEFSELKQCGINILSDRQSEITTTLFFFEGNHSKEIWTGDLAAINGMTNDKFELKTVDATSVNHLYFPNLVELDLSSSNLKRVDVVFRSELPSLKILDLSKCKVFDSVGCDFSNTPPKLGDIDKYLFLFIYVSICMI